MRELLKFLEQYELWAYVLIGVVAFIYLQRLLHSIDDLRDAVYGLERETARRRFTAALSAVVLLFILAGAIFVTVTFVSPTIPWDGKLQTATLDLLTTPTATIEPTDESIVFPGEQTPTPSAGEDGCIPGTLEWTYPISGEKVSGIIEPLGTVNFPNLGFYKYEYAPLNEDNWITISAGNQIVVEGSLGGAWNTENIMPGDYQMRLIATDNESNYIAPCTITIQIVP
ncbi:MAG: hypothetical protein JW750_07810 [Anaerolineaceae bacterium]|nr:hypothetical protein [Anaerolineaceae bacterium]